MMEAQGLVGRALRDLREDFDEYFGKKGLK